MIIDAHTHIFPPDFIRRRNELLTDPCFRELYTNPKAKMATAEELIYSMDEAGINISVIASVGWSSHEHCYAHNDYMMEAVAKYPGRLIGLGMVQPLETKQALNEMERISKDGLKGIGEFRPDAQGVCLTDEAIMFPFMQALAEYNMVLMLHASEPTGHLYQGKGKMTPEVLFPFIQQYGEINLILAHWGGGLLFYELQPEVKNTCRNVYYDTAATPFLYDENIYELGAKIAGDERLLFGSDYPLMSQQRAVNHLESALLEEGTKKKILGANALKVFKIVGQL